LKTYLDVSADQSDQCDDRNPVKEKHDEQQHNRYGENAGSKRPQVKGKSTSAKKPN